MLRLYPDNTIIWVHMGLSRELADMDAAQHIRTITSLLDSYPKLMLDISWRVLDDSYFSNLDKRALYVSFLNDYSERILPGTDFLASRDKNIDVYRTGTARHESDPSVIWTTTPSRTSPWVKTTSDCWVWTTPRRRCACVNKGVIARFVPAITLRKNKGRTCEFSAAL